ncbi:MAG: hypothetical protein GXP15_13910 [Gammaproteobacteria bacterium]|nr:hypothetical protein [Gammaproteobacteria bacterium]
MKETVQRQVLNALLVALRPIAKMLLRSGIGYREFSEISKSAFVDVATKEYGLRGRPTNISRVAVMTGLTRKEIRRIRDKISGGEEAVVARSTPLAELLHHWHSDRTFLSETGYPLDLPFDSDSASFTLLVKRSAGDIPPGALRTELKRTGAIEEMPNGLLRPLTRGAMAKDSHDKLITGLVRGIFPLATAIAHNAESEKDEDLWIQRTVSTGFVRNEDLTRIRRVSRDRLEELTESIDDLFVAYETLHSADSENSSSENSSVGLGVFYYEA